MLNLLGSFCQGQATKESTTKKEPVCGKKKIKINRRENEKSCAPGLCVCRATGSSRLAEMHAGSAVSLS